LGRITNAFKSLGTAPTIESKPLLKRQDAKKGGWDDVTPARLSRQPANADLMGLRAKSNQTSTTIQGRFKQGLSSMSPFQSKTKAPTPPTVKRPIVASTSQPTVNGVAYQTTLLDRWNELKETSNSPHGAEKIVNNPSPEQLNVTTPSTPVQTSPTTRGRLPTIQEED
jgi:hypothetical protein